MLTSRVLLAPTLPTLLVDEHRGHHTPMLEAFAGAATRLADESPQVVVALSARWFPEGPFRVDASPQHRTLTDYAGLGVEVRYDCPGHPELARALVAAGVAAGVRVATAKHGVDSGVTVPLHFLCRGSRLPVVPISLADRSAAECRAWGVVLGAALAARPERIAFVAGGLLSNNEHAWGLRREVPETLVFDERVLASLGAGAWDALRTVSPAEAERAQPQAGLRHLAVLRGLLGRDAPGAVLGYESGPGVGAALVEFEPG